MTQRRPVVQILANLDCTKRLPEEAAHAAVRTVLEWLRLKQKIRVPQSAYRREDFEIDATHGGPVAAARVNQFWSLQHDHLDSTVPGRIWRTEASVGYSGKHNSLLGVRLTLIDQNDDAAFEQSVPSVVRDLITKPGLHDYGICLSHAPTILRTESETPFFFELLANKERTRPVVAISAPVEKISEYTLEAEHLANRLAGLAHVFVVHELASRALTVELGREFSVWGGAYRTYFPRFNPDIDEVFEPPRDSRRLVGVSHAALAYSVSCE